MKRERLELPGGMSIDTSRDLNGRYWIAYVPTSWGTGHTQITRNPSELRKALRLPKGTTSRQLFDDWLKDLEAIDAERICAQTAEGLSVEIKETGFGPECHDDSDPVAGTKMVI